MRIALIITELHPGGAEKCFVHLACYLKQQGHEVAVWQLWPPPPIGKRFLVEQLEQHGIPWSSGGAVRAWHFLSAIQWLKRELKIFQPDIVQSFLFHANVASALAIHGIACKFFGGARVRQPQRWRQWIQHWAAGRMCKLICVSQSVAQHCREKEGIAGEKLLVIPNGIDLSQVPHSEPVNSAWQHSGIPADAPILLFVGRLTKQKGVEEFFLHAADQLLEGLPQHHLVLIGDGELAAKLAALRNVRQHAERIHLLGWQPSVWECMARCQVLLLPARYEGMPNAVMEAMALGKPVVCFDVDGVRELLGDSKLAAAQIAIAGDFSSFTSALKRLAQDAQQRAACGKHNRQRIEQAFQLDDQLARYLKHYEQP